MIEASSSYVLQQAGVLLAAHREHAPQEAGRIADSLAARRDIDGYVTWQQVRIAAEALLRETAPRP